MLNCYLDIKMTKKNANKDCSVLKGGGSNGRLFKGGGGGGGGGGGLNSELFPLPPQVLNFG